MRIKNLHQQKFEGIVITDSKFKQYAYYRGRKLGKVFLVPHGVGIKFRRNFLDSYFENNPVDIIYPGGPVYLPTLQQYRARRKDVLIFGFPKTDFTVNNKKNGAAFKAEFIKAYGFDKKKKILLYAPTWSRHEYSYGTLKYFKEIYQMFHEEYNLILAPHSSDFAWFNKNFKVDGWKDFCYYMEFNKNKAILAADVVISDNSSLAIEAALIDKPVVHLINSYAPETMHLYLNRHHEVVRVGEVLKLPEDMKSLKQAVLNPAKSEKILNDKKRWVNQFCKGCTGDSRIKIANHIEQTIKKG